MSSDQLKIIETALIHYYSHCVTQSVKKRGRLNLNHGESMTNKFKQQKERIEELRIGWKRKAMEVKETINHLQI